MSDLKGQIGELRATITIKRKATGKVDTYELVGRTVSEQAQTEEKPSVKENDHGNDT